MNFKWVLRCFFYFFLCGLAGAGVVFFVPDLAMTAAYGIVILPFSFFIFLFIVFYFGGFAENQYEREIVEVEVDKGEVWPSVKCAVTIIFWLFAFGLGFLLCGIRGVLS